MQSDIIISQYFKPRFKVLVVIITIITIIVRLVFIVWKRYRVNLVFPFHDVFLSFIFIHHE